MKQTAKRKNLFRTVAILLLSGLWVMLPFILNDKTVNADELSDTRIQATLSGAPINGVTPAGFSEFRLDDSGRRRLEVQASSLNLAAGTVLTVTVNNASVGQISVNGFGGGSLNLDTNNGQTVPMINFGNPIQVKNGAATILSGTFGTVTPTPSPSGSPNGSPSPTASPTGSPNGTPSPTVSPTGSPNGTPSPTVSPTVSPTATPNGTPSPSPTASPNGTPSPSPSPSGGDLFAGLSGGTINGALPNGFAQYELHSSRTELEVRVYQVNLPIGTPLTVTVNTSAVGQIILESGGQGRLRLRSDRGQNVPVVTAGTAITIQNGGASVLSGTFAGATASPSPSGSPNPSPSASPSGSPNPSPSPSASPTGSPNPSPSPSPGLGRYFEVHPTGARLDPPVSTTANGEFKVFLNADETQATLTGEFHNLSSAQTGAKIETQIGSGTVIHNFGAIGGTGGNFAGVTINVTAIQVQLLRSGLWFVTLSSVNHPNGEIGGTFVQHSGGGDFDGDGSNDLAVFRPSSGTWFSQNTNGFSAVNFGGADDTPVSADYDGDGKTDRAVFKNVNGSGIWEIYRSSDGGVTATQFGYATDKPLRGDFDGDGRNDIAVYRPSEGVWYVQNSNGTGYQIVQFGIAEDIPMTTDMDGDGKSDITVFRPSNGLWFWINSSTGSIGIVRFGLPGDKPVKGDFDGDGRDDVAVYRPSTGVWYIYKSSDGGYDVRQFGLAEDIPVAGNYDGDNKTDLAVFRPSSGDWYIWRSVDNTYEFRHFGLNGDIPTVR